MSQYTTRLLCSPAPRTHHLQGIVLDTPGFKSHEPVSGSRRFMENLQVLHSDASKHQLQGSIQTPPASATGTECLSFVQRPARIRLGPCPTQSQHSQWAMMPPHSIAVLTFGSTCLRFGEGKSVFTECLAEVLSMRLASGPKPCSTASLHCHTSSTQPHGHWKVRPIRANTGVSQHKQACLVRVHTCS